MSDTLSVVEARLVSDTLSVVEARLVSDTLSVGTDTFAHIPQCVLTDLQDSQDCARW